MRGGDEPGVLVREWLDSSPRASAFSSSQRHLRRIALIYALGLQPLYAAWARAAEVEPGETC